jgi:hypothetical protein
MVLAKSYSSRVLMRETKDGFRQIPTAMNIVSTNGMPPELCIQQYSFVQISA